jgi:uncharacterized protein YjbI with pentapeptide repeats
MSINKHSPGLSEFDLQLLNEVNNASAAARNSSLFFIGICAYCYITLVGISHHDLLLNTEVILPFLQVKIPQRSFSIFAPALVVIIHFAIILQHIALSRKIRELDKRLRRHEAVNRTTPWRLLLNSYSYTQAIAGRFNSKILRWCSHAMTRIPLGLAPVLLLLLFQLIFLPFHDVFITSIQRALLLVNIAVLIISIGLMGHPEQGFLSATTRIFREHRAVAIVAFGGLICVFGMSVFVATIPGEYLDRRFGSIGRPFSVSIPLGGNNSSGRTAFYPTACLFEKVDPRHFCYKIKKVFTRLSRNIIVTGANIRTDGSMQVYRSSLRGRNLEFASLERSDLSNTDLSETNLYGANLANAKFIGAEMNRVNLREAILAEAHLEGAELTGADLSNADLTRASLHGANLADGDMTGANLTNSILIASDLSRVKLSNSTLEKTDFRLANLREISLDQKVTTFLNGTRDHQDLTNLWIQLACSDELVGAPILKQLISRLRRDPENALGATVRKNEVVAQLFRDDCGAARRIPKDGADPMRSLFESLRWESQHKLNTAGLDGSR